MKVWLHPEAERDVVKAAEFYEREVSQVLASRFVQEFERVLILLLEHPAIGAPRPNGRRSFGMRIFPYSVPRRPAQTLLIAVMRKPTIRHTHTRWRRARAFCAGLAAAAATTLSSPTAQAATGCLTECTPRIGIVSAFGEEATILLGQTGDRHTYAIHGNRYTTGVLRGNRVVIVLSGVSMINSTLVTQTLLDHFRIERLVMSGISGGVNPAHHVGDVLVPERWAMPMEIYWNQTGAVPAPCGPPGDVSCLGMKLAEVDGRPVPPYGDAFYMRQNHVMSDADAPDGGYRFDYEADPAMLAVARDIAPPLARCGPRPSKAADGSAGPPLCVGTQPRLVVGGRGVSGTAFLANADYRRYLYEQLHAETFEMETAAFAHVAYVNGVPYIAFRSLSDLAGATEFNADVGALFSSGLAETNESAVTLAFLEAWHAHGARRAAPRKPARGGAQ